MPDRASAPSRRGLATPWRDRPLPLHPLLLAAWPVLFLYGQNIGELRLAELIGPLSAVVAAALVTLVAGAYVMRDARRAALVVSVLAATLLLYGHVADVLTPLGVRAIVQEIGWIVLIAIVALVAVRAGASRVAGVTTALNLVTAILVALALVTIVPAEVARFGRTVRAAPTIGGTAGPGRDIYFIIFDRYGSARSLQLLYGIDDRPFLDGLRARGFQVVTDSHANYVKTTLSLASTLNLDYLDDLVAAQDPASADHGPIFERLSDHAVGHFLRDRGYRYIHVGSGYGPTETSALADENPRFGGPSDFLASLYDTSAFPAIAHRLGLATAGRELRYEEARFQLDTLDKLASRQGPVFVFAHILVPHPPFVFARDGSFVTDELDARRSSKDKYGEQLAYLNTRIDELVGRLLDRPEAKEPIIIMQADEGPYPPAYSKDTVTYDWSTASSDELEIKFGILNAMYLPGADEPDLPPTLSSVNTFRLVFGRYFDADLPLLPDRSFTSAGKFRPYDMTEITHRLPSLSASTGLRATAGDP
jgi:sulfatase-like protein